MHEKLALPSGVVKFSPAESHRRQMNRQVWLPLILTLVVVLALTVLAVIGTIQGSSEVNRWGNISTVLVIIPTMIWGVVLLAVVGGSAYGVTKLLKKVPGFMLQLQALFNQIYFIVRRVSDASTRPIFAVNTTKARSTALWNKVFHGKASR